jgi:hypothetical protein
MDKEKFKIIIPDIILEKIKEKGKPRGNRDGNDFKPVDLLESLYLFINDEGENGLKKLNPNLHSVFKNHIGLSPKTLSFAFCTVGEKDDGATSNLCNLLCHLRFKDSWKNVLRKHGFEEDVEIQHTKDLKAKKQQENNTNIYQEELKKRGKLIEIQEEKKDTEIKKFANNIYIELITRKAAIPLEEDKDVIEEVYNSWYTLFKVIREEIKKLQFDTIKNISNSESPVGISIKILNDILRPHLTEHQAKFRSWLDEARQDPKNKGIAPQELQKKYPDYKVLMKSLKKTNEMIIDSAENLYDFMK